MRRPPQPHRVRESRPTRPRGRPADSATAGANSGFKRLTADAPRDAACAFIAQHAAKFPMLDLAPLDETELGLEGRDAAFAHAIVDAVLRRWLTLRHIIQTRLTQPFESVEAPLQAALLVGAAQVVLLDRVPAYAAIDHAVEWSKRRVRPGAGGMANAVLRKVATLAAAGVEPRPMSERYSDRPDELPLPDGRSIRLAEPVMGEDPLDRLACSTGHPRALLDIWAKAHGQPAARALALHGVLHAPTIVRVAENVLKAGLDPALFTPHDRPGFAVFSGSRATLVEWLGQHHDCWVQDPASTLAVESIADLRPRLIIDACAGQGTKTRQLARTFPEAQIIATDTDDARRKTLLDVFEGHPRVRVIRHEKLIQHAGQADMVLLDVPCSNTGVLARRPEAKYRFVKHQIEELEGIQRQILADAIPLLSEEGPGLVGGKSGGSGKGGKRGGLILYSTCSLQPSENAGHIAWAKKWHNFEASRERVTLPKGAPGAQACTYQDGSYSVVLGRWALPGAK